MRARWTVPLLGLTAILVITGLWWGLALWPLPDGAPEWWARARAVCFGAAGGGLPDASGWMALVLQPMVMIGTLLFFWGEEVGTGLRRLRSSAGGSLVLGAAVLVLGIGVAAATGRVLTAQVRGDARLVRPEIRAADYPRLERPAPELGLVDQAGQELGLGDLRGRVTFVTFAYAHCQTVCPLIVRNVLQARDALPDDPPAVVVVTLDPWRDTPARLPYIAEKWGMRGDAHVLSGEVPEVNRVLDAWNVTRQRDPRTGEITHPALAYILDREGTLAYAVGGDPVMLAALAGRL